MVIAKRVSTWPAGAELCWGVQGASAQGASESCPLRAKELEYWLGEAEKDIIRLRDKLDRLEGGGGSKS